MCRAFLSCAILPHMKQAFPKSNLSTNCSSFSKLTSLTLSEATDVLGLGVEKLPSKESSYAHFLFLVG